MRALIRTLASVYAEKIDSMLYCTFNEISGLMLIPIRGDKYFIEMPKHTVESYVRVLYVEGKVDLQLHVAQLVNEDTNALYEDYLEYN